MEMLTANDRNITQGTIVDNVPWVNNDYPILGIVISNPCDLNNHKASFITIAGLVDAGETLKNTSEFQSIVDGANEHLELKTKPWDSLKKWINSFIHNKSVCRYFFINPGEIIDADPFLVDFQNLITIPIAEKEYLVSIAQLSTPYAQQMIVHFSSYISRIGVDRIDEDSANLLFDELVSPYNKKK